MTWLLLFALVTTTPDESARGAQSVVEMVITPKVDKASRWCSDAVFEATIRNPGPRTVWLELGDPSNEMDVAGYFVSYSAVNGTSTDEGSSNGGTDGLISIDVLRSSKATMLRPGEFAVRPVRLDGIRPRPGRPTIDISVRIHGTQDLDNPHVQTYEPSAAISVGLRRRGRCLEVRRLG